MINYKSEFFNKLSNVSNPDPSRELEIVKRDRPGLFVCLFEVRDGFKVSSSFL